MSQTFKYYLLFHLTAKQIMMAWIWFPVLSTIMAQTSEVIQIGILNRFRYLSPRMQSIWCLKWSKNMTCHLCSKGESICLSQSDPGLHLLQSSYFQNQILYERWKECSMFVPTFQSAQEAHTISVAQYNPQWFLYFALTGGASYYQNADSRPMIIPGEFENVISGYHSNLHMWQVICASFEEA